MKIMLIEDEYPIAQAIKRYMEEMGHSVETFFDGLEAIAEFERDKNYEVFIVDINLPGASGLEFLRKVKSASESPVIIISGDNDIETIDAAYKLGTEDYLKKPFHIKELAIKLEKMSKNAEFRVGFGEGLIFDKIKRELYGSDGKAIELTKKELLFLELLLANRGKIVTNDQIQNSVYEYSYMSDLALRTLVKRVRIKVGKEIVQNVSGLGYKIEQ